MGGGMKGEDTMGAADEGRRHGPHVQMMTMMREKLCMPASGRFS